MSHDLRTIITRFRLSLVLLPQTPEIDDLQRDVDEMSRMLEAYLAFAKGDSGEPAAAIDLRALLEDVRTDVERLGGHVSEVTLEGQATVTVRPDAFRRCLFNLAANAARYGDTIAITARQEARWLAVSIDDDGPGIPLSSARRCSSPSCASTTPARMPAARGWASPSPSTSRARMAATWRCTIRRWGACGRRCGCRRNREMGRP